jgi:hypothetical protein
MPDTREELTMGLLSRLFGRDRGRSPYGPGYTDPYADEGYGYAPRDAAPPRQQPARSEDERAIERYRYLLRTAPPDQVEAAHAEAFGKLTPEQRRQVLEQLSAAVPANERPRGDDPQTLARTATRAELRQPGFLERTFSGGGYGPGGQNAGGYGPGYGGGYGRGGFGGGGMGMGSMIGGSLLGTVAGVVVGSAVADALFDTGLGDGGLFGGGDEEAYADGYQDGAGADGGGDYDASGADGGFDGGGFDGGGFDGGDFGGEF